jgi:hypothetical protein
MTNVISLASRRPITTLRQIIIAEPDDSDDIDLAHQRRRLVGRHCLHLITGTLGQVTTVERRGGEVMAKHWTSNACGEAVRFDWRRATSLDPAPRDPKPAA